MSGRSTCFSAHSWNSSRSFTPVALEKKKRPPAADTSTSTVAIASARV
eukprot:CAMPEP_0180260026 /NCGR_PEP_ID=MMETSP0987-20121128/43338_1 /TAXON_ID=697907 /ORGANISM="non described non described, Strain CCMP2293" /LENGTH=47 /DNA_ID= /DNA_START= /DNA_END= /DNA_ORIENTATION=